MFLRFLVITMDRVLNAIQHDQLPMTLPDISRNRTVPLEQIVIHGNNGPRILDILYTTPNLTSSVDEPIRCG
jgi:hypothetical protein